MLVQETLLAQLSSPGRVRLHARIAEALERAYGDDAAGHAAELARHYANAESVLGNEKSIRYSLLAGEQALESYSRPEALVHFRRVLDAKRNQEMDDEQAAALFGSARALSALDETQHKERVLENSRRAFAFYVEQRDVEKIVAVAAIWFFPLFRSTEATREYAQRIEQALAWVAPDSLAAGRLLNYHAMAVGFILSADYTAARKGLEQALEIARRHGDEALEASVCNNLFMIDEYDLRTETSGAYALRAAELAASSNVPLLAVRAFGYASCACRRRGEVGRSRAFADRALTRAERLRDPYQIRRALSNAHQHFQLEGRWEIAREHNDRLLTSNPKAAYYLLHRALLEYELGEEAAGASYLGRAMGSEELRVEDLRAGYDLAAASITILAIARVADRSDLHDLSERITHRLVADKINKKVVWLAKQALGLLAVLRGDAADARRLYQELTPYGTEPIPEPGIFTQRLLGLLAATAGELDEAADHLEETLAFSRTAGFRPEAAWTCHDYADTLLERGDAGDRDRAEDLLAEGLAEADELGMRPLAARIRERLNAVTRPMRRSYPDGITEREAEVLRFIARGKTNKEIASEMFISPKTVDNHIMSIRAKIGLANKAEAASYAIRHGLT